MKIHLHSQKGLYQVETYGRDTITCSTKHGIFQVPASDFKSFAGGHWNDNLSKDDADLFLSVVNPEKYKRQVAIEDEIITLAQRVSNINTLAQRVSTLETLAERIGTNKADDELDELKSHMRNIARQVYSQNLDFSNFRMPDGIKFIIQQNHHDNSYRFCWDPYRFVSNYHSDISNIFNKEGWCTINGGWVRIIGNDVVLYAKSGDYGVYDDAVAIECAKKVFPEKNVHSFAGRHWDEELDKQFFPLPF